MRVARVLGLLATVALLPSRMADLNWSAELQYIRSAVPDLVVHAGDISLDGAHEAADLA